MKKVIIVSILLINLIAVGQDISFDKIFFNNKLNSFNINQLDFSFFKVLSLEKQRKIQIQSVLFSRQSELIAVKNRVQPIDYKLKKTPYSINYEQNYVQCGPLQLRNSEDMMVGAVIDYIFNKYVVSLFLPTPYDD